MDEPAPVPLDSTLAGGGEMGARMRALDWTRTPLGPVDHWPRALKTCVRIMLTSRQPMWLGWGDQLTFLYNDPYRSIVGGKHPHALGQPTSVVWREIWTEIAPRIQAALGGEEGTYDEALLLIMERYGYPEETYYTFSYSPIPDDAGRPAGIFCANTEDTRRVTGERQIALLRDLAAGTAEARTVEDACAMSLRSLESNPRDLPFAVLYLLDSDRREAVLGGVANIVAGHPAAPALIALDAESIWPFLQAVETNAPCLIADLGPSFGDLPAGAWDRSPHQAVALPVAPLGQGGQAGVLIVGLNPYRPFTDDYRGFLNLVAGQIAAAIAAARAHEEERRRAEALAELDRAKTVFFNNISHEFRTPLTLMLGPLEDVLAVPGDADLVREQVAAAHRNTLRLLRLVNTLLDFSRVEGARMEAVYEPTDLAGLTTELTGVFRSTVERAGLRLLVDCPPLSEQIYVDHEMWEKIVLNLLSNAFKFTLTGEIAVALGVAKENVVLTVRDTGTGIPAEELPHIFERFHRVRGTRARTHEGTGIGLALAHDLVRLHGGTIGVESELDIGTTFTITLPLGTAHLPPGRIQTTRTQVSTALGAAPYLAEALRWLPGPADAAESQVIADVSTSAVPLDVLNGAPRARVLLADDNADLREYLTRLLAVRYDVRAVADGTQALAAARETAPDLVLSDVMMPELDGYELVRALRADPRTSAIPIVLLSARAGEESTVEGLETGADDYLIKPFSARELLARVATHLQLAQVRREARDALAAERDRLQIEVAARTRMERRTHEALEALLAMAHALVVLPNAAGEAPAHPAVHTGVTSVRHLAELARRVLDARRLRIVLLEPESDVLRLAAAVGTETAEESDRGKILTGIRLDARFGPEVATRLRRGETIILHNQFDLLGIAHLHIVPMVIGDKMLGYIAADYAVEPSPADGADMRAEAAAQIMALLLERERLLAEREEARAAELALRETTRRMDEFVATASHELKTPVTSIRANVQLALRRGRRLLAREDDPTGGLAGLCDLLERAEGQTERMVRLLYDLLDVSRLHAGHLELRPERCDLREIVTEQVEEQRVAWPSRVITCRAVDMAVWVNADPDQLGQVVTNFLTNALKYSAPDRPVAVEMQALDSDVIVRVCDEGVGLDPLQSARVWERFERVAGIEVQDPTRRAEGGLGLGLYLSRSIVERHGGRVGVESTPGVGSTFWFALPAINELVELGAG